MSSANYVMELESVRQNLSQMGDTSWRGAPRRYGAYSFSESQ
jgi:hypothetical protein